MKYGLRLSPRTGTTSDRKPYTSLKDHGTVIRMMSVFCTWVAGWCIHPAASHGARVVGRLLPVFSADVMKAFQSLKQVDMTEMRAWECPDESMTSILTLLFTERG